MATGVSIAKMFSSGWAPLLSPPKSRTQTSSPWCRATSRSPTNPGPVSHEDAVMKLTTAGPSPCASNAFHNAQRQKYT